MYYSAAATASTATTAHRSTVIGAIQTDRATVDAPVRMVAPTAYQTFPGFHGPQTLTACGN